jgi:hypothetical protein
MDSTSTWINRRQRTHTKRLTTGPYWPFAYSSTHDVYNARIQGYLYPAIRNAKPTWCRTARPTRYGKPYPTRRYPKTNPVYTRTTHNLRRLYGAHDAVPASDVIMSNNHSPKHDVLVFTAWTLILPRISKNFSRPKEMVRSSAS